MIKEVLEERGSRYGRFDEQAEIVQAIKKVLWDQHGWDGLEDDQKEALETIAVKISRILNGDPDYQDNWVDIAGYATLISERLVGNRL